MSLTIVWDVPTTLVTTSTYAIAVYRSTSSEDGTYEQLTTGLSARQSDGSWLDSYADGLGQQTNFYYVTYTADGGTEGRPVLAIPQPTIRESRLIREFKEEIPAIIRKGLDSHDRQILSALRHGLQAINAIAPVTAYSISNMPDRYETAVRMGAMIFFYATRYLNVAIRDFSYGVAGLSLNIDRGAKINQAIRNALDIYNQLAKSVKLGDWADPIGLGSFALSTPQGRVAGFLFGTSGT